MFQVESLFSYPLPLEAAEAPARPVKVVAVGAIPPRDIWSRFPGEELRMRESGFEGKPGQVHCVYGSEGGLAAVVVGINEPVRLYDFAAVPEKLRQVLKDGTALEPYCFELDEEGLDGHVATMACIGWELGCYRFETCKSAPRSFEPRLIWPRKASRPRVEAFVEALYVTRTLINLPANLLGPEELEAAARAIARRYKASATVHAEKALEKGFPLVFAVGDSSPRRPRVIELGWGKAEKPEIALVGKGVCFDTGGLHLKPGASMDLMKKDMGGAAHALGVAILIMKLRLPVRLRVIIPAVENSVSGTAFRPGDVFPSRKGLTVENANTDAEGRLILADCLTLASEGKPALIVDFSTLTGSARAGLGFDIPALFSNRDKTADELKNLSFEVSDPLWPLPLWEPYRKEINGEVADLCNIGKGKGDAIHAALFLREFLKDDPEWIHLDMYAWEHFGRPGRPKGGAETGLISVFTLIERRYPS